MTPSIGIALGLCCLILSTVSVSGIGISLKPNGPSVEKPLGQDGAITCVLDVPDKAAITNFKWLDPRNVSIDGNYRNINPRIRTQLLQSTSLMLLLSSLKEQDGGMYTCTANYNSETLTTSTKLIPFQAITFVDAPTDQMATIGTKYKIKCQVQANPPPTVEWTRNSVKLQNSAHYILEADGLILNGVEEEDDGEYKCEVIVVDTGEVKSRDIHLEVLAAPKIVNLTEIQLVTEGEKCEIICQATGKPKPEVVWIQSSNHQVVAKGVDGRLFIEKVTRDNNVDYTCQASNKAGTVTQNVHLSVRSKPEVFDVRNGTAVVGGFGQVQCFVYANPKPSIRIRKFGFQRPTRAVDSNAILSNIVDIIDSPTTKHVTIATMNFTKVERYDDGLYECVATNEVGTAIRSAHLTVEFKPEFDPAVNVKEIFSWARRTVNLTCTAEAIPNATITWYANNRKIERSDNIFTLYGRGSPSTLQVSPLDKIYYQWYKCLAENKHGSAEHSIQLREAFQPGPVDNYEFNTTTATSITFRITDPMNSGGLPIRGYIVQYFKDFEGEGWATAKNETWPRGAAYVLRGLEPSAQYTFRFAATNEVGIGLFGPSQTRRMPDMSPPSEPTITNAQVEGERYIKLESAKKFELRWQIPPSNGAEIDRYELKYCIAHEEQDQFVESPDTCKVQELPSNEVLSSFSIGDLIPDTLYKVELKARNNIGYGQPSVRYFKTSITTEPVGKVEPGLSSAVIIYIVMAILIAFLVIVDIFCFFVGKMGVLHLLCGRCCGRKKKNSDDKLGSETKDLISNGHKKIDIEEQSPMITNESKKDTAVEYDLKKGTAKTGFVGKDSAV